MITKMIEATNRDAGGMNWGKFMVCRFTPEEWAYRSAMVPERSLLHEVGWDEAMIFVLDLQTGEGAMFRPKGYAVADLHKHRIWVCPMFEPFLTWLYEQNLTNLDMLPAMVQLDAESALYGYRRKGRTT